MKIWANTVVNNEENFIWFAIMSVVDFVDKILVWDTGSTDKTVEIIKEIRKIKGEKIDFKEVGSVDKDQFTNMRQAMLDQSNCDWILILDGDEVWWESSTKKLMDTINKKDDKLDAMAVPFYNLVGDIFHYQGEKAGRYQILGRKGHINLRVINRKIPGLHVNLPYGKEGYYDGENRPVQERDGVVFVDAPYLHATHLERSSQKRVPNKVKFELGSKFPEDFIFPEVFYQPTPKIIPSPWKKMSLGVFIKSAVLTLPRKIKRRIYG